MLAVLTRLHLSVVKTRMRLFRLFFPHGLALMFSLFNGLVGQSAFLCVRSLDRKQSHPRAAATSSSLLGLSKLFLTALPLREDQGRRNKAQVITSNLCSSSPSLHHTHSSAIFLSVFFPIAASGTFWIAATHSLCTTLRSALRYIVSATPRVPSSHLVLYVH